MSGPRILVIGQGSIGRRHATNLVSLGASVTAVDIEFDGTVPRGFDGVVVASPTRLHHAHALAALDAGCAVLVEKPLAWSVAEARQLAAVGTGRTMVGYNLRFHEPLRRIAVMIADGVAGRPVSFRFWFGQWLPDWRPLVDYRATYSARSELGGGVLADAIHELDLAVWMAGEELSVLGALVARVGPLEIDVEDTVRALLVRPDGVPVTVDLDYLSRRYRRGAQVIGDEATITYDWSTTTLRIDRPDHAEDTVLEFDQPLGLTYETEAAAFLALVRDGTPPDVTAEVGLLSVELAELIRAAGR